MFQLKPYNPFLNSRSNWSMFKDLKTQMLTLPNRTLIVPNWTLFPNLILSSIFVHFEPSSSWWVNQQYFFQLQRQQNYVQGLKKFQKLKCLDIDLFTLQLCCYVKQTMVDTSVELAWTCSHIWWIRHTKQNAYVKLVRHGLVIVLQNCAY